MFGSPLYSDNNKKEQLSAVPDIVGIDGGPVDEEQGLGLGKAIRNAAAVISPIGGGRTGRGWPIGRG